MVGKLIRVKDGPSIETPPELLLGLEAARQALADPHVRFGHQFIASELVSILEGNRAVPAAFEDRQHLVLPLLESHWIGLQLKFRTLLSQAQLRSASLIVVRGLATGEKVPLLRAEWERLSQTESQLHAQPHWHVYTAATNREPSFSATSSARGVVATTEAEDRPIRAGTESPSAATDGMRRFHFAMAVQWHTTGGQYSEPTPEGLGSWIRNCISYTRTQLEYISRKLPAG